MDRNVKSSPDIDNQLPLTSSRPSAEVKGEKHDASRRAGLGPGVGTNASATRETNRHHLRKLWRGSMVQTGFNTFEQFMVGLAWPDTRIEMEVTSLCSECHRSWFSPVIPVPKQHILQFDHIPSSIEFDHILSELREEESELEALDKEVARPEVTLFRMRTARTWLLDRMRQRKSVISVIRRAPVEIWDMIFKTANSMMKFSLD
ncbi:hypothetical protein PM082_013902 [Marasmius tenuissimus]|nr:hypothetical protein PM082_013902 [Marasmius tenuissimus]